LITSLNLDKRLRDKQLRSGGLSKEELASHLDQLQDRSENVRYRKTDAELLAEAEAEAEARAAEAAAAAEAATQEEGVNHESQED
jgi:hypothetical protein